jgi:hypothetical protein
MKDLTGIFKSPRHEPSGVVGIPKYLKEMARSKRFELLTPRFVVWCSIQLSYERACG